MGMPPLAIKGQPFGRLRPIAPTRERRHGAIVWVCLCDPELGGCGAGAVVSTGRLQSGVTRSCGCLLAQRGGGGWKEGKVDHAAAAVIRKRVADGERPRDLAARYRVTTSTIYNIVHGRTHARKERRR